MLRYFAFSIPFTTPFKTAAGTFTHRNGLLLVLEQNGVTAYGEVAPLPGFSTESIGQVLTVLLQNRTYLENGFKTGTIEPFIKVIHSVHALPSLAFGLDTLTFDYLAKTEQKSLQEFIFKNHWMEPLVNSVIGLQAELSPIQQTTIALDRDIHTIKVKVGQNFEHELATLTTLRNEFPEVKIRIDANQAWSVENACQNLSQLAHLNIEYCEQPVPASDFDGLKKVSELGAIPIAADEAVRSFADARKLIEEQCCKILVLKPALFGRFQDLIVTKELAATHGMEVVFTTAFDAAIGRAATAKLASGLGSEKYAQGLATGFYLNEPGNQGDEIIRGKFSLSKNPGVGAHIDLSYYQELL